MAQPAGTPKIDELRARVKADPKSRLFYPLAEELRKIGQLDEAEDVLVAGLAGNPTYLSAWVSLGRVLKDLGKTQGAVEALNKALSLDRENVVAARLLAHMYLDAGDKVEAIKKFKFVHAILPTDLEVEAHINQLELELNPPSIAPVSISEAPAEATEVEADTGEAAPPEAQQPVTAAPAAIAPAFSDEQPAVSAEVSSSPFMPSDEEHLWQEDVDHTAQAAQPESPVLSSAPPPETVAPFAEEEAGDLPLEDEVRPPVAGDDLTATVTMGDLYAQQGHFDSARGIYEKILASHPDAEGVRAKLQALPTTAVPHDGARRDVVVRKLHDWLSKVSRRESVGRV